MALILSSLPPIIWSLWQLVYSRKLDVISMLVIAGIAGGDGPLRGFLAAYKATTGEQAWRFWTVPKPGEPSSETWNGNAIETGGGATWLTGSYDVETGTLYWAVGNPFPATDGDEQRFAIGA